MLYPGGPTLWFHKINWPVLLSSVSSHALTSLTVPSFLFSSAMYVPWSTLVNHNSPLYHIQCFVLAPWHVIASVSPCNQELFTTIWDVLNNYRNSEKSILLLEGWRVTPVGFEPTPWRNGALSHRLRPLGQSVHVGLSGALVLRQLHLRRVD